MSTFVTLLRAYLKFYVSTRRFVIVFVIYALISAIFPIVTALGIIKLPSDVYGYTSQSLGNYSFATVLVAAILGGDALSQDFGRQGLFTLTQPVRRSLVLAARYTAAFLASATIMVVFFDLLAFGLGQYYYGQVVPSAALITGTGLLLVASTLAAVILFSSLFKSPAVSIVVAVIFFWLAMPTLTGVLELVHIEPWFFITYAGNVVGDLAAKAYPPLVNQISAGGPGSNLVTISLYNPTVPEATAIMLAYLVVSLLLAWAVYSRRELKETA